MLIIITMVLFSLILLSIWNSLPLLESETDDSFPTINKEVQSKYAFLSTEQKEYILGIKHSHVDIDLEAQIIAVLDRPGHPAELKRYVDVLHNYFGINKHIKESEIHD